MFDVGDGLLNFLVCSFCKQHMQPPILACGNRHNVCSNCKLLIKRCSICLGRVLNTRNPALEDLANSVLFPCWKRAYGCTARVPARSVPEHKITCQFKTYTACPYGMIRGMGCDWKGDSSLARNHLHRIHRIVIREVGNKFKIVAPREGQRRSYCEVISVTDTLFFYVWEVTAVRVRLSVFYIGSENIAYRYKYVFAVCKRSSRLHHSWAGRVLELHEWDSRFSDGNSVSLKMSTFLYIVRHYPNPFALKIWKRM